MGDALNANLLGQLRFAVGDAAVTCTSKKALALFVFLLLTRKAHSRRELAALLWGQRDETGRASLRAALHRLPPAIAACLDVDREWIRLALSAPLTVDAERFEALAGATDLDDLETAASLYQDELLKNFEADATPEFDDWLHGERVRFAQLAQKVFEGVVMERIARAGSHPARAAPERESALAAGLRWASLMPGIEAAHRWLMRIYVDMGRRDAALAQYELCQRSLAVHHGRAPAPETRALHAMALGGATAGFAPRLPAEVGEGNGHRDRLGSGVPSTSFFGRLEELAELDRLLADPACRLITLHGMGGAGKTRLAYALATQVAHRFAQGCTWVALDALAARDHLPAAIAQALGRELPPRGVAADTVAAMLAGQQRLLVLDNFESLLVMASVGEEADPVRVALTILEAAPRVRIVITSREVLGLQEEWVYAVGGLPYAGGDANNGSAAPAPAVELFAERARQAYLGFSLSAEMPHVQRICSVVEGLPLALELAAAWVRTVPCGEIAATIEREAAALRSTHRNRPLRHQNLQAVVAYSWSLLADEQRAALAALGAFAGGFTREAADRVAGAQLRTLSVLVDKALVRRRADGRYDLHELVRQFASARLQRTQARRTKVLRRHADYFANVLLETATDARGTEEVSALARFNAELPNVLAAWRYAIDTRLEVAERMAAPLIALLHTGAMLSTALGEAERAVAALQKGWRADTAASVRMQWGRAAVTGGRPEVARRELDAALSLARAATNADTLAHCIYYRASLDYQQGDLTAADRAAQELLSIAEARADPELRCLAHNLCGILANMSSRFDVAESHLRQGLAAARERGAPSFVGSLLCSLAVPLYYRGQFAEATALTREAATIFETLGRGSTATMVRGNLAALLLAQGDVAGAQSEAELAVHLARESADDNELSGSLNTLSDILMRQGNRAGARAAASESLRIASAVGFTLSLTEAHFLLASISLGEGNADAAYRHLVELRDALAKKRLPVRVPMLVLGVARWAVAIGEARALALAERWLRALGALEGIDSTIRDRAHETLSQLRETGAAEEVGALSGRVELSDLEAEVGGFLDRLVI